MMRKSKRYHDECCTACGKYANDTDDFENNFIGCTKCTQSYHLNCCGNLKNSFKICTQLNCACNAEKIITIKKIYKWCEEPYYSEQFKQNGTNYIRNRYKSINWKGLPLCVHDDIIIKTDDPIYPHAVC